MHAGKHAVKIYESQSRALMSTVHPAGVLA